MYEQAIKRAKAMIPVAANQEEIYNSVITIFPELRESEDEKIRKELLEQVVYIVPNDDEVDSEGNVLPTYQKRIDKYLAWLEKQVHVDEDEIVKGIRRGVAISLINHIDANSKGMCLSNMECQDIENAIVNEDWDKVYGYMKKKLEKQGEQPQGKSTLEAAKEEKVDNQNCVKPVNEVEIPFGAKDSELREATYFIPKGFHAEIDGDKVVIKKGEKKSSWSEEDDEMVQVAINACNSYQDSLVRSDSRFDKAVKAEDWLKDLKDRVQPQTTWKPSDEQMVELRRVISGCSYDIDPLTEMEEQLKKLMEE